MSNMSVTFGGIELKNPVVVASAPPTETVDAICRCAEAGAAAVITKTMSEFDPWSLPIGARRAFWSGKGFWALSTFRRETLTLDAGATLIQKAVKSSGIPIFASVGGLSLDLNSWYPTCFAAQQAGASLIQLDLFHVPHPRCAPENIAALVRLINDLASRLDVPIMPKLNIDLPADVAVDFLPNTHVRGVIILDSIRTPVPIDVVQSGRPITPCVDHAGECSLFGEWQKPITLQYTAVLMRRLGIDVLAGGGLMSGKDAAEAILLGATAVQFATAIIRYGYPRIAQILTSLKQIMEKGEYGSVSAMRSKAARQFNHSEQDMVFENAVAVINHDACIKCRACTGLVFCQSIEWRGGQVEISPECEGCGLCVSVCTSPGALTLKPRSEVCS